MRYKVKGLEIRSENAAKPMSMAAKPLVAWIHKQSRVTRALDYGCGKLRYAPALATRCHELTLVDSAIQIDRVQSVDGTQTTVRQYAAQKWRHARVLSIEKFEEDNLKYDLALCANVLSTIPNARVRSHVLRRLLSALAPDGKCLFVAQYQNSYFKDALSSPNALQRLDGWVLKSSRGNSYYGLLNKEKLESLIERHGFLVFQSWRNGQSAYVLGSRP